MKFGKVKYKNSLRNIIGLKKIWHTNATKINNLMHMNIKWKTIIKKNTYKDSKTE